MARLDLFKRRTRNAASLAVVVLGVSACPKKHTAYADCRNLEKYESGFGVLNAPQFGLGAVIDLNTQTHTGGQIRLINLATTDTSYTKPVDSTSILSNADFKLKADADIPATVQAAAEAYLNNHTLLTLKNYVRNNIKDPAGALARDATANADLLRRLRGPSGHIYLLVSSLVLADVLDFSLSDKAGTDTKAKVISTQGYDLTIDFSCQATLTQRAHQGPLLFKAVQLALASDGTIEADAVTVDLKNYNLNLGILTR